ALVVDERVGRVIGRADRDHPEPAQDAVRAKVGFREPRVGTLPDRFGRPLAEEILDPEVPGELEMGPVKERIAKGVGYGPRPREDSPLGGEPAGASPRGDAVRAHRPPFVMVAVEPDVEQALETAVLSEITG